MRARRFLIGAAAAASLVLAGCNRGDDPTIELPDTTTSTGSIDGATTTSGGGSGDSSTTSTGVAATGRPATPELAASGLFDAWKARDRSRAHRFATDRAVNDLFGSRGSADGLEGHGCEPEGAGRFSCAWRYEGGGLIMTVEAAPEGGFVVESIRFIAD